MAGPIVPAVLRLKDGAPYSEAFGDTYWSLDGGPEEARHVFLSGNDLPARWMRRGRFTILETGFGTGLNFLCAWRAFRDTAPADARLHYLAVDKHPFRAADLARLHAHWPELAPLGARLIGRYPPLYPGFHRAHLDGGRVTLTLIWGEACDALPQVQAGVDAFFLDGFAPARNPEMWHEAVFAQLARLAAASATFATYTVAGDVRRGLASAGFHVEKREGFGRKREMLAGRVVRGATSPEPRERHAVIIGAGLAGTLAAERLVARGWRIDLVERRDGPARETSGNPVGVMQPVPSADWNRLSRLTLAGFHYALRRLADFDAANAGVIWRQCGVLRLARDARNEARQRRIAEAGLLPPEVLRWVDAAEASRLAGGRVPMSGWWFPEACCLYPYSLCSVVLRIAGEAVRFLTKREAVKLVEGGEGWRVLDEAGSTLAEAPVVILANGHLARRFAQASSLPLRPVRGQITCIPDRPAIPLAISREGYVTPPLSFGVHVVGATYEEGSTDETVRLEDHRANLKRLEGLLPDFAAGIDPARVAGRAGIRTVGADRLPLVGGLNPETPGLHGLLGLGSRGLVYAPLAAELLASQLEGDPLPIGHDLVAALDPGRPVPRRRSGVNDV